MRHQLIAILLAAAVLPVAAQTSTPRVDTPAAPNAKLEIAQQSKPASTATPKERAKVAKAQDKQGKKARKQKKDKQKAA
jgi:hypothetical protein